jgi:DNA polymerase V
MIALVDCNNFYASCERLFAPQLNNKPIVILSNNDGCVISRSNEAKELGIEMGAPAFMMEEMLNRNQVAIFSSNYTLYGSISNRVMQTLNEFVPEMEIYSIDEAFLNLDQLKHADLFQLAKKIRNTIILHVGIPVTIGIAPTKTLAKMANRYAKKERKAEGIYLAETQEQINELLAYTRVEDIWGIGSEHSKKLAQQKIFTAAQLISMSEEWIRKNMTVTGQRMFNELKAVPCIGWEWMPAPRKAICTARSFGQLLSSFEDIREALANYAGNCARKMRNQQSCSNLVQVFLQTNTHRTQDKQYFRSVNIQLPVATNDSGAIIAAALKGLRIIYREGYNFKKVGVMVLDLVPEQSVQLGVFDDTNHQRSKQAMAAFDSINTRFGKDIVRYAVQGYKKKWKLKQEKLSPCYTTNINEVLTIKN